MAMAAIKHPDRLIDRLPAARGEYREDVALARYTWFRVGGPAEVLFLPADQDDLQQFLAATPPDVPVTILGVASNLLIRDGGIPGVVIRLRGAFNETSLTEGGVVAGAGALDINVARYAAENDLGGLEFLSGIPGTVGGALRMNAGAYGREIRDVLISADTLDRSGVGHSFDADAMGFSYRHSGVPGDHIFVSAIFAAEPDDPAKISARLDEIGAARNETQPIRSRTGGSTFKNPEGQHAWELIDAAGCRGLRIGGAQVSEKHCNFLVNTGSATAHDVETLGEEVRRRVLDTCGVELQWEIRRVGIAGNGGRK